MKKIMVSGIVFTLLLGMLAPINFSFSTVAEAESLKQTLAFFNPGGAEAAFKQITDTGSTDDSLSEIQEYVSSGKIQVKPSDISIDDQFIIDVKGVAFPKEQVEKNVDIKKLAQNALISGKKVYLYGQGLTVERYKNLLGLEKMSAEVYPANVDPKEYGKKGKPELTLETPESVQVIGYTNNKSEPNQIYLAGIHAYPLDEIKPDMYLQAILDNEIDTHKKMKNLNGSQKNSGVISFVKNKALADSTQIKTFANNNEYTYDSSTGVLKGRIYSDIILFQDLTERDTTYDFFTLRDNLQVNTYNGAYTQWMLFDHDVPFDVDELFDWSPKGDSSFKSQFSISIPWGLNWAFETSSWPSVDDQSDLILDYARWRVTSGDNPFIFQPGMAWLSTGTYAAADVRNKANYFWSGLPGGSSGVTATQLVNVRYDYATSPGQ